MHFKDNIPTRRISGIQLLEVFLFCSVATIVVVRGLLYLTGYPQLGAGGLHIAHMLWGGLLLTGCLIALLLFINNKLLFYAGFFGGIGFGLFIDELGKFITSDNNYFFRPTFALIYGIFIIAFLLVRFFVKNKSLSKSEIEMNTFEKIAIKESLTQDEKDSLFDFLREADLTSIQKQKIIMLLDENSQSVSSSKLANLYDKLETGSKNKLVGFIRHKTITKLVSIFFMVKGISFIIMAIGIVLTSALIDKKTLLQFVVGADSFDEWGVFISSLVMNIFILLGVFKRHNYLQRLKYFQTSVLISLFFCQFFTFFSQQLSALSGVLFDFALYFSLSYMQQQATPPQYQNS